MPVDLMFPVVIGFVIAAGAFLWGLAPGWPFFVVVGSVIAIVTWLVIRAIRQD